MAQICRRSYVCNCDLESELTAGQVFFNSTWESKKCQIIPIFGHIKIQSISILLRLQMGFFVHVTAEDQNLYHTTQVNYIIKKIYS